MTDREKAAWACWLIGLWSLPVLTLVVSSFGQWTADEIMVRGFAQAGQMAIVTTSAWGLTLAFRMVYLGGKRKGGSR